MSDPSGMDTANPAAPGLVLPRFGPDEFKAELASGQRELTEDPLTVTELMRDLRDMG